MNTNKPHHELAAMADFIASKCCYEAIPMANKAAMDAHLDHNNGCYTAASHANDSDSAYADALAVVRLAYESAYTAAYEQAMWMLMDAAEHAVDGYELGAIESMTESDDLKGDLYETAVRTYRITTTKTIERLVRNGR